MSLTYSRDLPAGAPSADFQDLLDMAAEAVADGLWPVLVETFPDDDKTGEPWGLMHNDEYPGPTFYRVFTTEAEADAYESALVDDCPQYTVHAG